jgi:MarR family transcriptional regulator, lower aerobic nicotinate degradation pathway regulator
VPELAADRDGYDPPPRLRALPSWLVAELARRGRELVTGALAGEGARRPHYSVLASLAEQGPASQAELGRRLWIDRSDLHALVSELEATGLIARRRDEHDRRRNVVTLTKAGAAWLERLDLAVQRAQDGFLEGLTAHERTKFERLLEKLVS